MPPMLYGLGADATDPMPVTTPPTVDHAAEIDGFLLKTPSPASSDVAAFLKIYPDEEKVIVAQQLIQRGVDPHAVSAAMNYLERCKWMSMKTVWGGLTILSGLFSGVHGYRRNKSVIWAAVWFTGAILFPVVTPVLAIAQGWGKPK